MTNETDVQTEAVTEQVTTTATTTETVAPVSKRTPMGERRKTGSGGGGNGGGNGSSGNGGRRQTDGMAAGNGAANGLTILDVDPELILTDPEIKSLRDWSGVSSQEMSLPELARMIGEEGQKQPAVVRETPDGYMMVDGERRRQAIILLRQEGHEDAMLRIVVDPLITDEDKALRNALTLNIQRAAFSAIERAKAVAKVRQRYGWKGQKGTAQVADHLGVSPATVTESEKLLALPEDVQADIATGRLSETAARDLIAAEKETQTGAKELLAKAKVKAEREQERKQATAPKSDAVRAAKEDKAKRGAGSAAPVPVKVTGKHIRQVAKEAVAATGKQADKVKAPKMSEAVDLFESWNGPAYPPVMAKFAESFGLWGHGKMSDKKLEAAWDDVADQVAAGRTGTTKTAVTAKATVPVTRLKTATARSGKRAARRPPAVRTAGRRKGKK